MRQLDAARIREAVKELFIRANYEIGLDVEAAVRAGIDLEPFPAARNALEQITENYDIARCERVAICQDTGMAVLFAEVGQDVHIEGDLRQAVDDGVRDAYRDGFLRKSVVNDPLFDRRNTGDNAPAVLHVDLVPGDRVRLLASPKGFGSENMSRLFMLSPSEGVEGVLRSVVRAVVEAGPNPCPPVIVGVGIGGTMEKAALIAKRMTTRPVGSRNEDARYAELEERILKEINRSGVGPAGIGGRLTALAVNIGQYPTHIAGLPVAVNMCCHCARHAECTL